MSDELQHNEEAEIEIEECPAFCYACGDQLRSRSILVCAECLGDECDEFLRQASKTPEDK